MAGRKAAVSYSFVVWTSIYCTKWNYIGVQGYRKASLPVALRAGAMFFGGRGGFGLPLFLWSQAQLSQPTLATDTQYTAVALDRSCKTESSPGKLRYKANWRLEEPVGNLGAEVGWGCRTPKTT